ncbi:hypothetical protein [Flavobacterium pedocola]
MKNVAMKMVWATTLYLIAFAVLCQLNVSLPALIGLLFLGFLLIPFMVYKVLTDDYTTSKSFDDWYEDYPMI